MEGTVIVRVQRFFEWLIGSDTVPVCEEHDTQMVHLGYGLWECRTCEMRNMWVMPTTGNEESHV